MSGPTYSDPSTPPGPPPGHGAPPAYVPPPPAAPQGGNGFAVAALIFGIIGGSLFGLVFGFLGLSKAKKVGKGKGMSITGIVLSVVWLAAQIAGTVYIVSQVSEQLDPGCSAARTFILDDTKMNIDSSSEAALKADLQDIVDELNADAAKAKSAAAKTAIQNMANDFQELLDAVENGEELSADFDSRIEADGKAIDAACGTIGG